METIQMKIPYVKTTTPPHEIDIPKMLDMVTDKLDMWVGSLTNPFTRKDAFTLLSMKEEPDYVLLKYGINRNKWVEVDGGGK